MELVYSANSPAGQTCALVALYAEPKCGTESNYRCLCTPIGVLAARTLFPSINGDFVTLLLENGQTLKEPVSIIQYICEQSGANKNILLGDENKPAERASVMEWITMCANASFNINTKDDLNKINVALTTSTFIGGSTISVADIALMASLSKTMTASSDKELILYTNISRWFDHMQYLPGISGRLPQLPLVTLPAKASADIFKKACKSANADRKSGGENVKRQDNEKKIERPPKNADKQSKNSEKQPKNGEKQPADTRPVDDVTRLELRVGKVLKVWKHPDAESLYCEEVDLGPEIGVRQIASGLVKYMTADQLEGRKVVVLANLKAKALRGFPSHGMLMCASHKDDGKCEILNPPEDTPIGERVVMEGLTGEPDATLNSKSGKDPFAATQPHFITDDNCVAYFKTHRFMTSKGPITCASIKKGSIS